MLMARTGKFPHALQKIHSQLWTNLTLEGGPYDLTSEYARGNVGGARPKEGYTLRMFNLMSTFNDSSHNLSPLLDSSGLLHFYGGRGRVKQFDAPGRGGIEHFR